MIEPPDRQDAPFVGDERAMLSGWLDYHRATLAMKCAGLDDQQLAARAVPPSNLSLLGLVRHMADVERAWFSRVEGLSPRFFYATDERPDRDIEDAGLDPVDADVANWTGACAESRAVTAKHTLEDTFVSKWGNTLSLRWVLVHMIEEYARHNGHADLLRECIDGATGE
jgi:uncharacterized damage-inducible protein DinB